MQVREGTIDVDQSALTGESLPVTLRGGVAAQMGATVVRGEVQATGELLLSSVTDDCQLEPFYSFNTQVSVPIWYSMRSLPR